MKKRKKRIKIKGLIKLILFLALVGGILYFLYNLCDTSIKNIYISGNNYLLDQDIIELANLDNYPDFYTTSSNSIEKKIKKNPFIKSVKVKKRLFQKLNIEIEEKRALFIYDDNIYFDDKSSSNNDLSINLPILINYTPDVKFDSLIKKMTKIDFEVLEKVSEIKYDPNEYDEDRFLLYMNDSNLVYLTLTKFDYLNKYNDAVTKLEGKKGILYLDSGNYFEILG